MRPASSWWHTAVSGCLALGTGCADPFVLGPDEACFAYPRPAGCVCDRDADCASSLCVPTAQGFTECTLPCEGEVAGAPCDDARFGDGVERLCSHFRRSTDAGTDKPVQACTRHLGLACQACAGILLCAEPTSGATFVACVEERCRAPCLDDADCPAASQCVRGGCTCPP